MPKDNNVTNSQEGNAVTNGEAESHHHNIPGDNIVKEKVKEEVGKNTEPPGKKPIIDKPDGPVPNQANTGEPE